MAYRTSRQRFEELTEKALADIPLEFRERFKNIAIIVKDYPEDEISEDSDIRKDKLLGLFVGQTYEHQSSFFAVPSPYPDTIYLYQKNIESICNSEEDLCDEIRSTVLHEVGHYFGLTEEDLKRRNLE